MNFFNITKRGYKFDKRIFWAAMILIFSTIFLIMWTYKFDFSLHPYFNCKFAFCENPYYKMDSCSQELKILWVIPLYKTQDCRINCKWCNLETLTLGEYGERPNNFLFNNMSLISFIIILIAFGVNHLIHNKGRKFDVEIPITKKIIINRDFIKNLKFDYDNKNEDTKNNRKD